jgi:hypothetical protein
VNAKRQKYKTIEEVIIDAASPGCKVTTEAIRILKRDGKEAAIRYLRNIPGTNLSTLAMLNEITCN